MGSVYEAEHTATGRRVAVKIISSKELVHDEAVVARFQREARAAGAIDTQHITQVLDAGRDHETGLPFLVMEFMSGEDLQHVIKRTGPLAPDTALRIVAQACLGLQKAHEAHVVHRDIKPANLFLARRDAGEMIVKLLDFGIAKVKMDQSQETESAGLTKTGSMLGSPLYMSPEQARGIKDIDHRADIWSLGVVLYQALSGRTPFQHITSLGQLIIAICSEWPPHIQEVAPWVPPQVAEIVHRALRHRPEERYQSASEMFAAIRQLLPHGWSLSEDMLVPLQDTARGQEAPKASISMPPPPPLGASLAPAATAHAGASTTGPLMQTPSIAPPPPSSSKMPLVIAAVALVGAIGVGGWVALRKEAPVPVTAAQTATAAPMPTPPPAPTPAPTPSAAPSTAPAVDTSPRRVVVVIQPKDAQVEIEGEKATAKNGLLEITGTLGSVHRVRVFRGTHEVTTDVIVTEYGAKPPNIELTFGSLKKPGTAAPTATQTAQPPPTKPGIMQNFE